MHIEVGTEEVLHDDSIRFADKATKVGNDVELVVVEGALWQHFGSFLPEARESIERGGDFFRRHI